MTILFLIQHFFELSSLLVSLSSISNSPISHLSGNFGEIVSVFDLNNFFYFGIIGSDNYNYSITLLSTVFLSLLSGAVIGFILGLIGGGGSILAVPLLVYVIGVDIHTAIGTSALAVAANALINLSYRIGKGSIKVKEGILFAAPGTLGALIGSELGLMTPPGNLMFLFTIFMVVVAIWMLKNSIKDDAVESKTDKIGSDEMLISKNKVTSIKNKKGTFNSIGTNNENIMWHLHNGLKLFCRSIEMKISMVRKSLMRNHIENNQMAVGNKRNSYVGILSRGLLVGIAAGYFGIGGGFLIVPALIHAVPGIGILGAVATSMIPVSAFGFVTSFKYALVGEVSLFIALIFIIGGAIGGIVGTKLSYRTSNERLSKIFAILLLIVGFYVFLKSIFTIL